MLGYVGGSLDLTNRWQCVKVGFSESSVSTNELRVDVNKKVDRYFQTVMLPGNKPRQDSSYSCLASPEPIAARRIASI